MIIKNPPFERRVRSVRLKGSSGQTQSTRPAGWLLGVALLAIQLNVATNHWKTPGFSWGEAYQGRRNLSRPGIWAAAFVNSNKTLGRYCLLCVSFRTLLFAKSRCLCYTPRRCTRDSVAQWIERFPAEEKVGRSSRPGVATFLFKNSGRWQSPVECTALEMRQGVIALVGSNPTLPAISTLARSECFFVLAASFCSTTIIAWRSQSA